MLNKIVAVLIVLTMMGFAGKFVSTHEYLLTGLAVIVAVLALISLMIVDHDDE